MRWALLLLCAGMLAAQVPGAPGRTTGARGNTHFYQFSPGLGTINCSGATCTFTSGSVSPGSQVVSGNLTFNASHDADFSLGGAFGS